MAVMTDYWTDHETRGRKSETVFYEFATTLGWKVAQASQEEQKQKDIDFHVSFRNTVLSVEVKSLGNHFVYTEDPKTGRLVYSQAIVVEEFADWKTQWKGWIYYCQADVMAYTSENTVFLLDFQSFREYYFAEGRWYRGQIYTNKMTRKVKQNGDTVYYQSAFYLYPVYHIPSGLYAVFVKHEENWIKTQPKLEVVEGQYLKLTLDNSNYVHYNCNVAKRGEL